MSTIDEIIDALSPERKAKILQRVEELVVEMRREERCEKIRQIMDELVAAEIEADICKSCGIGYLDSNHRCHNCGATDNGFDPYKW